MVSIVLSGFFPLSLSSLPKFLQAGRSVSFVSDGAEAFTRCSPLAIHRSEHVCHLKAQVLRPPL